MEVFDNTPNGQGKRYGVTVDLSRTECQTACACLRLRTIVRAEIAASVFETEICDFRQGTPKIHRELRAPEQSIRTIVRSYWSPMRLPDFEQTIKLFGITGAMGTFIWGVFVWRDKAIEDRAAIAREQKSVAITRKIEATRPFLEQQLAIYVDAIQTVETIASSQSQTEIGISTAHFWRLYWGELAIQALDELNRVEQAGPRGFWL